MQGRKTNIIKFVDTLKASMNKLGNRIRKVNAKYVAMFEKLSSILDVCGDDKVLQPYANNGILQHLTVLKNEFDRYLPELSDDDLKLARNPFKLSVEIAPVHCLGEFLELSTRSGVRDMFKDKAITEFWPMIFHSYSKFTEIAIRALLPFVSTYLCELGFSSLMQIKLKQHSAIEVENDLTCTLSSTPPRIQVLTNHTFRQ